MQREIWQLQMRIVKQAPLCISNMSNSALVGTRSSPNPYAFTGLLWRRRRQSQERKRIDSRSSLARACQVSLALISLDRHQSPSVRCQKCKSVKGSINQSKKMSRKALRKSRAIWWAEDISRDFAAHLMTGLDLLSFSMVTVAGGYRAIQFGQESLSLVAAPHSDW